MQADLAPCAKMPAVISQVACFLDHHINVGDAMLHNHRKFSSSVREGIHVSIFPLVAFVACRGTREGYSGPLPPLRSPGNRSKVPQTADRQERRNLPAGNARERLISTSPSGTTHAISDVWYFRC